MPAPRLRGLVPALFILVLAAVPARAANDGVWTELPAPVRSDKPAFFDPARHRMIVFDGTVWSLDLNPGGLWSHQVPTGVGPASFIGAATILDPTRDRLVIWLGSASGAAQADAVWELSLADPPAWNKLTVAGPYPADRNNTGAVYDPSGDRMVIFAGTSDDLIIGAYPRNDAWALNFAEGNTWTPLATSGPQPPTYAHPPVVYDSSRDRLAVYSVPSAGAEAMWLLDLSGPGTWSSRATPGGPAFHNGAAWVYDAAQDRLVTFGGCCVPSGAFQGSSSQETWLLGMADSGTWSQLGGTMPIGLGDPGATYDPDHQQVVLFGGAHTAIEFAHLAESYATNDVWQLGPGASPAWSHLGMPTASPLDTYTSAFPDLARNRMLCIASPSSMAALALDETWSWSTVTPTGAVPPANSILLAEDALGRRVFAYDAVGSKLYSYLLDLDQWNEIPTLQAPVQFYPRGGTYDALGQRLIVYGAQVSPLNGATYGTTWILNLGPAEPYSWQEHQAAGPWPDPSSSVSIFFDSVRNQLVAIDDTRHVRTLLLAASDPWIQYTYVLGDHINSSEVFDARRNRILIFGGSIIGATSNGTASVTFGSPPLFGALNPGGNKPAPRQGNVAIYDARHDRMVIRGGFDGKYLQGHDQFALTFSDPPQPTLACGGDVVWTPGASMPVEYTVANESGTPGELSYQMTVDRAWPGFPLAGTFTLPGGGSTPLSIEVPVPDTAAVGAVVLRLWVGETAVPEAGSICTRHLHDATTPTRLALVEQGVEAGAGAVRLVWWSPDRSVVRIERRTDADEWSERASVTPDASGRVEFIDADVSAGGRYVYRAGVERGGAWEWSEEAAVDVTGTLPLAFTGGPTMLARGALDVSFTLPTAGVVRLEAFDVRGRRVAFREERGLEAGIHTLRLAEAGGLRSGIYFLRLAHAGQRVTGRTLVLGTR